MKISDNFDSIELSDPIFKDVKYYITGNVPEKVITLLKDGGARKTSYLSEICTHCIAGDEFEESDVSEAKDIYEIQAVTWKWVILSARCNTLLPVKGFLAERGQLFSGVVACVSQLNTADNSALWAMLSFYGGEMLTRLDASCTHLITAKPSGAKYERALREKEKSGSIEIVTPDWVCDSVKGNVRCEEVLYHPGLLLLEEEKKEEPSAVDPLASSLANITGFSEPDTSDATKRGIQSTIQAQNVTNLPPEQRMEKLMEMLDQRKQQEQQLISNQQQLSNVQLQQQQLIQQQNLINHPQQQNMIPQQQNLLNQQQNLMPQQQNLLVHQQQNLHQNQPGLQQTAIGNQPQQAGGFNQQPMLQLQGQASQQAIQQQRLQLLQQQQFQQRLLAQQQAAAAAGGGTVGNRVLLTPQQLQQRTLQQQQQAGGPWRQRVIITEGGKQYVVQEAAPQQQQGTATVQGQPGVAPVGVSGQQQPGQPQQYTVTIQRDPNAPGQQVTWQQQQFHLHQQKQLQLQLSSGAQGGPPVQGGQVAVAQPQQQAGQVVPGQPAQQPPQQGVPQLQQRLVWQTTQGPVQRQFIHLDPQTHQQLQQMDPQQRQIFLQKLHRRQQLIKLQQEQARLQQQQQQATAAGLPPPQRPQLNPQQQVVIRQQQQQRLSLTPQQQQQLWQAQRGEAVPGQQARTLVIQQQGGPQDQQQILLQTSAASLVPRQALGPQQQLVGQQTVASSDTSQAGAPGQQWAGTPPSTPGVVPSPTAVGQPSVVQPTQQQVVAGTNTPQVVSAVSGDMRQQQIIHIQRQQHIRRLQLQLQQQQLAQQQKQQGVVPPGAPGARMPTPTYSTAAVQQVGVQQQLVGQQTVAVSNVVQSEDGQQTTQTTAQPVGVEGQPAVTPQTQQQQFQQLFVNAKAKTALANMLSIRLSGSGVAGEATSAAGQLRLMTQQLQQHQQQTPLPQGVAPQPLGLQAGQNVQQQPAQQLIGATPGAGGVVNVAGATPQQQQLLLAYQQQQQQRRALGSLANNAGVPTQVVVRNAAGVVQATYTTSRVALASAQQHAVAPNAQAGPQAEQQVVSTPAPPPQQQQQQPATIQIQFFGHSPNIKVPGSLCLLGCVFYTMEYTSVCAITDVEKWHKLIASYGGEVESTYGPRVTHVMCPHHRTPLATQAIREGKRLVSAFWLNDVLLRERMAPPWQALHLPLGIAYNSDDTQPLKKFIISSSGFNADEKERIKHIVDILGGRYTGYFTKENKILICRKTEGKKYQQARLWHTTIVNAHWLHEIMQGHFRALHATSFVKYQQFNLDNPFALDYNSLAHLMMAWKAPVTISQECLERGKILQQQQLANPVKRRRPGAVSPTRAALIAQEEAENLMERPSKRAKEDNNLGLLEENGSSNQVYVLLSLVQNKAEKRRQVEELGGILTKNYDKVTHLVMKDTQRTVKLLCAVATVKYIVNEDWLADSYAEKRFLEPDKYIFSNTDIERDNNFTFRSLLQKTKRNELFKDMTFYLSPGVVPSASSLEDVIVTAGGRIERQRRGAPRIIELNRQRLNSYIVLADMNDLHLLVELINARIDIYMPELIFASILQQKLMLEDKYKLVQ